MAQDPDKQLDLVMYSEHIMSPFKKEFPNTYELIQYNMVGTLKLLKMLQIMTGKKIIETVAADHDGDDHHKTWSEYTDMITKNLQQVPGLSGWRMEKARKQIANVIHKQFVNKFPNWPAPSEPQSGYVYATCSGTHSAEREDQKFQVTWCCEGGVSVEDRMRSFASGFLGLSKSTRYYCEINGEPTFRILYFDLMKLKTVENKFESVMIKLKAEVDKLNDKETDAERLRQKLDALFLD